jgi:hypothetical protein
MSRSSSNFDLIKRPIDEITDTLRQYKAQLVVTSFPDLYMIKFTPETLASDPTINSLRGVIFNHKTGKIYAPSYPVPIEFKDQSPSEQSAIVAQMHQGEYSVQEALDGTLIRLWFYDEANRWIVSTNGKEDANHAFWMNGCSFADQFAMAVPKINYSELSKDYVYLFALCHPLNIIVVNHLVPRAYHLTTYDRTTLKEVCCELGLDQPKTFSITVKEVQRRVLDSLSCPVISAGYVVVKKPTEDGVVRRYRFENVNYTRARALRGNSNVVEMIILGYLLNRDQSKITDFIRYYPVYYQLYADMHQALLNLVARLFTLYGLRYKQHQQVFVQPRHHHIFLGEIHKAVYQDHLQKIGKTVQCSDIMDFVCSQPKEIVYQLLV